MEQTQVTPKVSQVSSFSFSFSDNGNGVFLLFVDKNPPSKHDLLVTDYIGTFTTSESAMDWYDKRYLPYGEPQALIARYNGDTINIILRSLVLGEEDGLKGHPAWAYAYDMEDDSGEDW